MTRDLVDAAVHATYAAAAVPDLWPQALDAIAACFDSVGTALVLNWATGSVSTIVSPSLAAAARDYEAWAWKLDFCMPRALEISVMNPDACYSDRHLATLDEIGKHDFYTKFRAPHGLGPYLATHMLPQTDISAVLTVQGRLSRETFTDEEIRLYATIARHTERALMLTVRLLEAEARVEALADALSRMSCGVLALDSTARVVFTNAAAERMIGKVFTVSDGRLRMDGPASASFGGALQSIVNHSGEADREGNPIKPIVVPAIANGDRVALYFLPIGVELPWEIRETFTTARLLLLAIQQPADKADPALIRDLLGLTHGEARVASLISVGKSPKETAALLGITEESARTVLKRVFAKTNTSRQSELSGMLARVVLRAEP